MIYICGDSFSVTDRNSGLTWIDLLEQKLPDKQLVNLSMPGASNYLIYQQVKYAINNGCEHLIYQATSSIRHEFAITSEHADKDSYTRYHNPLSTSKGYSVVCGTWYNLGRHHSNVLSEKDVNEINKFSLRFFDLAGFIEKNYIYITHTLNLIASANLKSWAWCRGGFEHQHFKDSRSWDFSKFKDNEILVNLWDYYDSSIEQPVYHITDPEVHQTVCNHYLNMLQLHNVQT